MAGSPEDLRALYDGVGDAAATVAPPELEQQEPQKQDPPKGGWWAGLKATVKRLKREVLALHYATHDPRLTLLPRLLAFLAIAYALSPLDLIPDFIPVLGVVDDVLILGGEPCVKG